MKKIKFIKPDDDQQMVLDLQYIIMTRTNSKLISMNIHRLCRKFVIDLKRIPLSEELQ